MPHDRDLMIRATWAHLVEGRTQESVARELGLTRAKANRLIAECRELGMVRIGIQTDARVALAEEGALKARYDLLDVLIVPRAETADGAVRTVGTAAGSYVSETLGANQTLAIGWGRTLSVSVAGVQPRRAQGNRVVTLLGSMVRGNGLSSFDVASQYARTLCAECCYLIAPRVAESAEIAMLLYERADIREAIEIAGQADTILFGVDDLSRTSTLFHTGQFTESELADLRGSGAVCTLQGVALDAEGKIISNPLAARTVGLEPSLFMKSAKRIVAAAGQRKARSIRALLRGGYCNVLITDEPTASAILMLAP